MYPNFSCVFYEESYHKLLLGNLYTAQRSKMEVEIIFLTKFSTSYSTLHMEQYSKKEV